MSDKLSDILQQSHDCGDSGYAFEGLPEMARDLESKVNELQEKNWRLKLALEVEKQDFTQLHDVSEQLQAENERLNKLCEEMADMADEERKEASRLKDQYESTPESRSNQQIVDDTKDLARALYALQGYQDRNNINFHDSTHPQERLMWDMACLAYDHIQGTEVECALDELTAEDIEG